MENINFAPFYVGQRVVAVDAVPGAMFKNGTEYTVSAMKYALGNQHHQWGG